MKKLFIPLSVCLCVLFYSCDKDDTTTAPNACVKVEVVDSAGLYYHNVVVVQKYLSTVSDVNQRQADSFYLYSKFDSLSTRTLDSTLKVNDYSYLRPLSDGDEIYKQAIYFENCGGSAYAKSIYTGDAGHKYGEGGIGVPFYGNLLKYSYVNSGTYNVTLVAVNVSEFGSEVKQSVVDKTFIIK